MPFILTTPLYYVNDKAHLGSTYTTLACDTLARFQRLEGEKVVFITGVDEHGQKIERTAQSKDISPKSHCDSVSQKYRELWNKWDISNDRFIRTTDSNHRKIVEQFFERVKSSGDIYMGNQKGWYCVGCEEYKEIAEVNKVPTCPIHLKALEWRDEKNLFFRLSRYQKEIEALINTDGFIKPVSRRNEVKSFLSNGLKDFSISRVNIDWGIPVPGYKGHTFYVWFDALVGYLSALLDDCGSTNLEMISKAGWPASIHMIGKDILRFHAIYWPAMLLSAGLDVPKHLYGHGFLTREGKKMGKSLGNVIDPINLLEKCGNDAVRWYLLSDIKFGQDGDFQIQRFTDIVNNDLANTIGNMVNRTCSMSRKWFEDKIPTVKNNNDDGEIAKKCIQTISIVRKSYESIEFHNVRKSIVELATFSNVYLNNKAPWKLIKDTDNNQEVANILYNVLESSRIIGILIKPLVPELSDKILAQLGIDKTSKVWTNELHWGMLKGGTILPKPSPILPKIEIPKDI